jgi:Mg2+ and Co2+ transporter CorA
VSVAGVYAQQADHHDDVLEEAKSGQLAFQLVETIAGPRWLVTCWHHSRICLGSSHDRDQAPVRREEVMRRTDWLWQQHHSRTSGDLGTQLVRVLVDTFRRAHRQMEAWLQLWELDYFKHHAQASGADADENRDEPETVTLSNLLSLVSEFRRRLAAFNNARSVSESGTWFPAVLDKVHDDQADAVLDRALRNLSMLFENVRADMDLVTMNAIAEQARAAADLATSVAQSAELLKDQRAADEAFQKQLGKVTALLLVPTLIAGVFGANTQLPGGGRWWGFEFMLVLMFVSSLGVYLYIIRGIRKMRL